MRRAVKADRDTAGVESLGGLMAHYNIATLTYLIAQLMT